MLPLDLLSVHIVLSLALALVYAGIVLRCEWLWRRLPVWEMPESYHPAVSVSVIVPARNEAENILACLQSVLANDYPPDLLEVLVVDDFSEDETAEIVLKFVEKNARNVRLLRLSTGPGGKKPALAFAVSQAAGTLIATTDADCLVPPGWLRFLASVYESTGARAIAGPVLLHGEKNLLQRFQSLDVAGLMAVTAAGIRDGTMHLGNGAHLAYSKAAFEAVGGYADSTHRASGDDLFLLQKIARRWPGSVFFLKNAAAAVRTEAMPGWRSFFRQRLRWGTKNAALPEAATKAVLALTLLFCASICLNLALAAGGSCAPGLCAAAQLALKALADYRLLGSVCAFFSRRELLRWFWPSFFLHTAYILVLGAASLFLKKYRWKGRALR